MLRRYYKQIIMVAVDFILLSAALLFAFWARLGEVWFPYQPEQYFILAVCLLVTLFAFGRLGLYRSIIRYMGQQAMFAVTQGVFISAMIIAVISYMSGTFMPRSVSIIYGCFACILIGGSRMLIRAYYQKGVQIHKERVAIYGAGTSGLQVYKALMHGNDYKPILFVDDNISKQGMILDSLPVYSTHNISQLLERHGITKVLLAMPSVLPQRRQEIMRELAEIGIAAQMVPGIEELLDSALRGSDVDRVYDSILGRTPVSPDEQLLDRCIKDHVVMVTGAAGSIGSELCRQILLSKPRILLLVDVNEYGLYQVANELHQSGIQQDSMMPEIISLLGNVADQRRMAEIIRGFAVQTIYHAAAYKHVPIVENNMIEGVRNNTLGTWALVKAAAENAVETFILISTDKAVRPVSMMGASKRCAELVCQAYARSEASTRFCMVRFGNVLGSSGSVVPLFFDQINAGGPVTVTHPDVARYFMTTAEAAQLVLQAGSMGEGGEVFVLDMGKPVKIMDLAERMIALLGRSVRDEHHPDGDIEIMITGLRPGEKLYEELVLGDKISGTGHPMIMRADESFLELPNLLACLEQIKLGCDEGDCQTVKNILSEVVGGFSEMPINDILWRHNQQQTGLDAADLPKSNIMPLVRKPPKNVH
ncbi:MAG TPA: nucleoside-diphosphate sugar epimerase/dehydratase [Pseudomonadales bacterium]|nr:nucleoside-diphosphate sugar epimerase/dehydratase [Pseudomonadales bacterium]